MVLSGFIRPGLVIAPGSTPLPAPKTLPKISALSLTVTVQIPKLVLANVNGIPTSRLGCSLLLASVTRLCLPTDAISPPPYTLPPTLVKPWTVTTGLPRTSAEYPCVLKPAPAPNTSYLISGAYPLPDAPSTPKVTIVFPSTRAISPPPYTAP